MGGADGRARHERFGAYGSDWSTGVTRCLGARFPEHLVGIHTPGVPARSRPPRSVSSDTADNVIHWTVFETGGHFPAIEAPALRVDDLRTFFRPLR